jgi:hypothetical protein
MIELAQNSYMEKGEMLLPLESVLEEAVKEGVITKEASICSGYYGRDIR